MLNIKYWWHFSGGFLCNKRMGKTKPFKAEKERFWNEMHNLMSKQAGKEKQKSEELAKTQISMFLKDEGSDI